MGYEVSSGALAFYFGSDLVHRLYHVPTIGEDIVSHFADTHEECLGLAKTHPEEAVRNSHSLQYFALDVYAYDIAVPGVGCSGKVSYSSVTSATAVAPSSTVPAGASATASAGQVSQPLIFLPLSPLV
jgi:hypothetical protein